MSEEPQSDAPKATILLIGAFVTFMAAATAFLGYADSEKPALAEDLGIASIPPALDYLLMGIGALGLYWGSRLLVRGAFLYRR